MTGQAAALQAGLLAARRTGRLADFPGGLDDLPIATAMAIQHAVMTRLGETAGISKIGMSKAGEAVAAPIFAGSQIASGETLAIPPSGISGLEVEIALRLGQDLTPDRARRGVAAILEAIETFHVGVELLGSRMARPREIGFNAFLADNLGSAGYVLQADRPWRGGIEVEGNPVEVWIDGEPVFGGPARHPFGGILVALQRYALAPNDLYGCCRAGHIITTGTLCGVIPVAGPCAIRARISDNAVIDFSIGG